jgi:hypothetical protein
LLLPPFADIFQLEVNVGGLPFTAVYLFGVWAALILGAVIISRQLAGADEPSDERNVD